MKFKVTKYQFNLYHNKFINEVTRSSDYSEDTPIYNYKSINVIPNSEFNSKDFRVFFNSKYGQTEYKKPNEGDRVWFDGPNGLFEFDRDDIYVSKNNSPYIWSRDLTTVYYNIFYNLIKSPKTNIKQEIKSYPMENIQKEDFSSKLNSLGKWLYLYDGLGLSVIIDKLLDPLKTNISHDQIKKFILGAKILKESGKIRDWQYDYFVKNLSNEKLVFIEGKWHPVNKLNTNYSELSKLLTDLLFKSKEKGKKRAIELIYNIINTDDRIKIQNYLLEVKPYLNILFTQYLESPRDLLNYNSHIKNSSELGDESETKVINNLTKLGYEILYRGGDGDFIDMKFSVDLIVKTPSGVIQTIQVKSSERQAKLFISEFNSGKHNSVDFVIYPKDGKNVVISTRAKQSSKF